MHCSSHFAGQKWNRVIDFFGDVHTLILTYSSLNEHIKYTHERKERPPRDVGLRCNDCVFESDSQEKLNTHVRKVHEQAKCNVCNVRLPKAELKLHVITEHNGKNFKCSIC